MKKITKGNDFRMYIPVYRIVEGAQVEFPLPACTDIEVSLSNTFTKIGIPFSIDREHDNVIVADVNGSLLRVGNYALEVKGKIFGNNWRSNEYEQIQIVDNNASADVDFSQDDGENSVIMDTAIAILAPDPGFYQKVEDAENARVMAEDVRVESERIRVLFESERNDNESVRRESEEARTTAETERTINENNRVESENIRLSNEEGRIAHEKARENNEAIRVANESERCSRETERELNESGRELSEDKRIANEQKRIADNAVVLQEESVRISNETSRKDNEAIRISHESDRLLAENKRIADEKTRQDNENRRVAAESLRADIFNGLEEDMRQAISEAELATVNADSATERAKGASQSAENASGAANLAADRANESADAADNIATIAQSAADKAIASADRADKSAEKTNTAISNAEQATENALAAAERAEDAAEYIYGGMEEIVTVACSTSVEGLSMQGLVINVYVNKSDTPDQYTTDENGIAFFKVKKGLTYEIKAPDIDGCSPIKTITHTAQFSVRNVEVIYKPYDLEDYEAVTLSFRKWTNNEGVYTSSAYTEGIAHIKYDDIDIECHSNEGGMAYADIPIGKSYIVEVSKPDGLVISSGVYTKTYMAEKTNRFIPINFKEYIDGILIVDRDGNEYTHERWVYDGRDSSDAVLLHIATLALILNSGDFFMSIDEIANQTYHDDGGKMNAMAWCSQNVLFEDIPSNGNSPTMQYYYDGFTATNLIANEGLNKSLTTPSATKALSKSFSLSVYPEMPGFLPSYGQWLAVIDNRAAIDSIMADLRPDAPYASFWTLNKGTSAQNGAAAAWYVGSSLYSNGIKGLSNFAAFPGYANSSL